MSYFPMFIELKNIDAIIIGGGRIALRKVEVLQDFGARLTVIAPRISEEIQTNADVICKERDWQTEDIMEAALVVAATDDTAVNHEISACCREHRVPVNAVDQIEDCDFIFPSYVRRGEVVAAFSSGGQSPVVTQYLKKQIEPVVTDALGALTQCLGSLRHEVKRRVATEAQRKKVYQEILQAGLNSDIIPDREQIEQIINKYS